jgi:DNA repair protein RecN (Recombination protein N)
MLTKLKISNFALIDNIKLDFNSGYSVITGETGAGKSILLKALNLLLGERADFSVLRQNDKKCVIEAEFQIKDIIDPSFFENFDLDFETNTIIRREITTSGKSRMFINDTPVTLNVLKLIGEKLVKIHTQHQTLELFDKQFQIDVLDSFAGHENDVKVYQQNYNTYKQISKTLETLKQTEANNRKEKDYLEFLLNELNDIGLDDINVTELQADYNKIQNWSLINESLKNALGIYQDQKLSPVDGINLLITALHPLKEIDNNYNALILRLNSAKIELQDIESDLEDLTDLDELDEERAKEVQEKIEQINALSFKHNVNSIEALIELKQNFEQQLDTFSSIEDQIKSKEKELKQLQTTLSSQAKQIYQTRQKNIKPLEQAIKKVLNDLAMPNAEVKFKIENTNEFNQNGTDEIEILFKTNLGGDFLSVKKTASGGELSRLMLAILSVIANSKALPTLIFDEIDTGVSGEVAGKMANVFKTLSNNSQLIVITHLPQIAGKGTYHYHVYKQDDKQKTNTRVNELTGEARLVELAKMISGEKVTDSAIENAKQLLV